MRLTLALAATLATATDAHAQTDCGTIADPAARLACYDAGTQPGPPAWIGNVERDVMTDQERRSVGAASLQEGCNGQPAILALVCIEPTLVLILNGGCFMGEQNTRHTVQYRAGDGPLTSLTMLATANGRALGTQSAPRLDLLLQHVANADEVHIRITPRHDVDRTFTFSTAGLTQETARIGMGCGVTDALQAGQ